MEHASEALACHSAATVLPGDDDDDLSLDGQDQLEFSQKQLSQLRNVVRLAIREEIRGAVQAECAAAAVPDERLGGPDLETLSMSEHTQTTVLRLPCLEDAHDTKPAATHSPGSECDAPYPSEQSNKMAHLSRTGSKGSKQSHLTVVDSQGSAETALRSKGTRPTVSTHAHRLRVFRVNHHAQELSALARRVNSLGFHCVVGVVIVLNAITIGIETQQRLEGSVSPYLWWIETICLSVFLVELCLRLYVNGRKEWRNPWSCFDAVLILCGVVSLVVLEPLRQHGEMSAEAQNNASLILLLRIVRLVRLVRDFRFVKLFDDMWRIISSQMKALSSMVSVMFVFAIVTFLFGCAGLEMISHSSLADNPRTSDIVASHFASLPDAMLTLVQFANADSVAAIYAPLIGEQPLLVVYFGALWIVLTVSLMNVITAIIVENALAKSKQEAQDQVTEKRKIFKMMRPRLEELFHQLDKDGSGYVSLEEVHRGVLSGEFELPEEIGHCLSPDQIVDAFDFLDTDMSGQIDCEEFVEGVLVLVLSSVPIETAQILHLTRLCFSMMANTNRNVQRLVDEA